MKGFQVTFFDATNIFPVNPIPCASEIAGSQAEEQLQLAHAMGGKAWPLMPRDKLSARYQNDPYAAFQLLSVTGQAYYMPDFLFMCERDSDRVGNLPKKLLDKLCADTPRSVELRSRFNEAQKKCIVRFFEDWFDGRDAYSLKRLRKKMGMQLK